MSIRLYIGNLPQTFEEQELVALLKSVGEGIRFKSVLDRETGACRGFGFANVDDPKLADAVIEALNGKDFGGSALRVERSERRDNNAGGNRRGAPNAAGQPPVARKGFRVQLWKPWRKKEAEDRSHTEGGREEPAKALAEGIHQEDADEHRDRTGEGDGVVGADADQGRAISNGA